MDARMSMFDILENRGLASVSTYSRKTELVTHLENIARQDILPCFKQ